MPRNVRILYATGNAVKFHQAENICSKYHLSLDQSPLDVPEIQAEDGLVIARDKAAKAFAKFQGPVVISDDNWLIPGLNNFPGPYMKSINDWFTSDDWLHLTRPLKDRRIILRQMVVYQDATVQKLFFVDIEGIILTEARGKSPYTHATVTSFDDGEHSNAEFHERGESASAHRHTAWHDFAEWYNGTYAN